MSSLNVTKNEQSLQNMKQEIEQMSKTQQIQVLKILKANKSVKLNENKTGVYVNLSFLSNEILEELSKYVQYVKDQNETLLQRSEA